MYDICCSFLKMLEYSGSSSDQDLLIMTTHFFCDRCGQGFETRRQLNNHLPIHRNEVFACRECEKAFVSNTKTIEDFKADWVQLNFEFGIPIPNKVII